MVLLDLSSAEDVRFGNTSALAVRVGNELIYEAGEPPVDTGLLAAWSFNEGSGTVAADAVGSRDLGPINADSWVAAGHSGAGLKGISESRYYLVPNNAGLQTAQRTLMFWVRRMSDAQGWYAQFYSSASDAAVWGIGSIAGSHYSRARVGGVNTNLTTTWTALGAWTHVAMTYDGATLQTYIDGSPRSSSALTGVIDTASDVLVFDQVDSNCEIDDLRMFDVALSTSEIQDYMNTPA